tara:strand:- start:301 stop:429 length:129 start_codon:yes stop_codon:yes gene_type:complete
MAFIKLFKFEDSTGPLKKEYKKGIRRAEEFIDKNGYKINLEE